VSTKPRRVTVYFEPEIHLALRLKAAETDRSVSELVNAAVRSSLAEDLEDLAAFVERARDPELAFEDVLKDMKRRGVI
jgi:hypothetical protein